MTVFFLKDAEKNLTSAERNIIAQAHSSAKTRDSLPAVFGALLQASGTSVISDMTTLQAFAPLTERAFATNNKVLMKTDGSNAQITVNFEGTLLKAAGPASSAIDVAGLHFAVAFEGLQPSRELEITIERYEKVGAGARTKVVGGKMTLSGVVAQLDGQQTHEFVWLFTSTFAGQVLPQPIKLGTEQRLDNTGLALETVIHDFDVTIDKGASKSVTISVFNGADTRHVHMMGEAITRFNSNASNG
jgi:hypothetical protein